jgi:hypothetical protein
MQAVRTVYRSVVRMCMLHFVCALGYLEAVRLLLVLLCCLLNTFAVQLVCCICICMHDASSNFTGGAITARFMPMPSCTKYG